MHVGLVVFNDVDYGLDLANALNEVGMSVTLYLSHRHAALYMDTPDRPVERLYELGLLPLASGVRLVRLPRMRAPRSFAVVRRLSQTIRDDGVDVAHILMGPGELWVAVLAHLLRDVPVTSTMITPKPHAGEYPPPLVALAVNKLLTHGSDVTIVNARSDVAWVEKTYRVSAGRVSYVPLGPRTTGIRWSTRTVPEEPGMILFFGRATRQKGLEYLVRAQPIITRQVPHARIVIVGHGEEMERCRKMTQDGTHFEIHDGFVPGDLATEFFQRASLFALPYLSAASSGVLMTAYAFGKPVVATRAGNLPEYVQDGVTGLLVPPANVEQLAEAIVRLLSDDALRRRMGENATRWMHGELSPKNIARQTLEAYEKAIRMHYSGCR